VYAVVVLRKVNLIYVRIVGRKEKKVMARINSKQKGARGERLFRDFLNEQGFTGSYRDAQQGNGVIDSGYHPDVVSPMLSQFHWEVKFVENLNVRQALEQAITDAGSKVPVVASKKKNKEWVVIMKAGDFLNLVKPSRIEVATLPGATEVRSVPPPGGSESFP
jgi:Holliday junction resolvase